MGITHVIRGSEWRPTCPLHSLVHRAFGWQEPSWAHLSVFLKPSGKGKMSKREQADLRNDGYSIFIKDVEELGYLPEAVVNWVALMGWSYDDHTEIFTLQDLVEKFSLEHLNPSPAAINFTKFDYFNGVHIRKLNIPDLASRLVPFFQKVGLQPDTDRLIRITPIIQERIGTLDEAVSMAGFFFRDDVVPDPEELVAKGLTRDQSLDVARMSLSILEKLDDICATTSEPLLRLLVEHTGYSPGQVFGILRVAVTGQKVSPPLFESMEVIGKDKVVERLKHAINLLEKLEGEDIR
jgi:glutamyl-tRNA synthetase